MSYCPYCGEKISSTDQHCPNCGAYLDQEPVTSPPTTTYVPPPPPPTTTYVPPPPPSIVPKVSRPIGVSLIAIITILEGIVFLGVGGIVALAGGVAHIPWIAVVGGVVLILGLISLALGVGLWNLRGWAWWLTIILEILAIIGTLVLALVFPPVFILTIISVFVLIYLLVVKGYFH